MKGTEKNSQKPLTVRIVAFCDSHLETKTGQPRHRAVRTIKSTLLDYVAKHKAGGTDEEFSDFLDSIKIGIQNEIAKWGKLSPHIVPKELFHKICFDFNIEGISKVNLELENHGRAMLRKYYIDPLKLKGTTDERFNERFNNKRLISDLELILGVAVETKRVVLSTNEVIEEASVEN